MRKINTNKNKKDIKEESFEKEMKNLHKELHNLFSTEIRFNTIGLREEVIEYLKIYYPKYKVKCTEENNNVSIMDPKDLIVEISVGKNHSKIVL